LRRTQPNEPALHHLQTIREPRLNAANVNELVDGVLAGDRASLSRAITLVESRRADHREIAGRVLNAIMPATGNSLRLGITGVPGVGKSTFIDALGMLSIGQRHKTAVLAIDPSSRRTRGSILGDKTRMARLAVDPSSFIRPSPAGEELGGVAAMTRETILLCEAAGYDVVMVETVGVGQSENAVSQMVDFFLVLMLPGAGDVLQGIKKGLVELADMIVINKADGENLRIAEQAANHYRRALHIIEAKSPGWEPPVLLASSLQGHGLNEIWSCIRSRTREMGKSGELVGLRSAQAQAWMHDDFNRRVMTWLDSRPDVRERRVALQAQVANGEMAATRASEALAKLVIDSG